MIDLITFWDEGVVCLVVLLFGLLFVCCVCAAVCLF